MKAIIAVNNLGYIGLKNTIPWRCTEDMKLFKKLTSDKGESEFNNKLLCGWITSETLPKLKDRIVVVDNREPISDFEHFDWCIGGKKTYEKWCSKFTELHISFINDNTIGDIMFPNLSQLNPNCKVFRYFFEINEY